MAFWIFKCNPKHYRLDDRLASPLTTITWKVTNFRDEIRRGDIAFIWETGKQRIRAVIRVEKNPCEMEELETEQQFNVKRDTQTMWRVLGTLTHRMKLSHALSSEVLRKMPGLENLSLFRRDVFQQGTNFRATPAEGAVLLRLAEAEHV